MQTSEKTGVLVARCDEEDDVVLNPELAGRVLVEARSTEREHSTRLCTTHGTIGCKLITTYGSKESRAAKEFDSQWRWDCNSH